MSSKALTRIDPADVATWSDRRLDVAIKRGHAAVGRFMAAYEDTATLTGVLLRERKARLKHGAWLPWLAKNFDGTSETARVYMRLADERVPLAQIADASAIPEPVLPPAEATLDPVEVVDEADVEVMDETLAPRALPAPPEERALVHTACPHCNGTGRIPLNLEVGA